MDILRTVQDGIEFYTVVATGENGISQSGLAIMAGVTKPALVALEKKLLSNGGSKHLEPFMDKAYKLLNNKGIVAHSHYTNVTIYNSSYCIAVLRHYAEGYGKVMPTKAASTLGMLAAIGFNTFVHAMTGYRQPCAETVAPA